MFLQPFFYSFRPLAVRPRLFTSMELLNITVQMAFNVAVIYYFNCEYINLLTASIQRQFQRFHTILKKIHYNYSNV